jgi:pPIWI_RE module N-terminal domain/RNaseH domain of pPIWI_RE/MID domain of pPIWI_RE
VKHPFIRLAAYESDPDFGPWYEEHRVLRFPEEWRAAVSDLYRRLRPEALTPPVRSLNNLINATVPGVIMAGPGAGSDDSVPWLYTQEGVPAETILPAVFTWVMGLDPKNQAESQVADILRLMQENLPSWTTEPIDLTRTTLTAGGTAQPDRRLFKLLPAWIARRMAGRAFPLNGEDLRFRIAQCEQGAELVSWPPREHTHKGRTWYYSGLLTITVQTVPFTARFRVHVSAHLRRWETTTPSRYGCRQAATVLFDVPLPWANDDGERLRLSRNTMFYNPREGAITWCDRSAVPMLAELDVMRTYPQPEELLEDPETWIRGKGGIAAAIVHHTAVNTHTVGAGLMPVERAELDGLVEAAMPVALRRVPDIKRAVSLPKMYERRDMTPVRLAVRSGALGARPVEIMIVWETETTRDELFDRLVRILELPLVNQVPPTDVEFKVGGLTVRIRTVPVGDLGSALDVAGTGRQARGDAVRARCAEVVGRFPDHGRYRRLALVELGGTERFPEPGTDPKAALRQGFAGAGMISQFIATEESADASVAQRAESAVLDGLRQLGAVYPDRDVLMPWIPVDIQYAALWLLRGKGGWRLVAVRVRPDDRLGPVQGWDWTVGDWVSYPDLLIRLATAPADDRVPAAQRRIDVQRQIRVILNRLRDRPTLMLVSAGNLRGVWPGLTNGNLVKDMVGFTAEDPLQRAIAYGPDHRIVVVRDDCGREETPQWYGFGAKNAGFTAGLWAPAEADDDPRVFFSAADASVVAKELKRGLRKLVPSPGSESACRKTAWNPGLVEFTVLACLSKSALAAAGRDDVAPDDPALWAAAVHGLRFHKAYEPLKLPLPLHLAQLAEEYVPKG